MSRKQGFTLIELIIVIVILGILAATAAPRFVDISADARIASLEGMQSAMQGGAQLIYGKALIEGATNGSDTIEHGGATIELHSGYPIGNWQRGFRYVVTQDLQSFSSATAVCQAEWCGRGNQTSIPNGISTTAPGRIGKIFPKGYSWNDRCGVYYMNHEDGREPEIGLVTEDC